MYREAPTEPIACPRCKKPMPPTEVTTCACGIWISAFAAEIVLTEQERSINRITRWWKRREPCPLCGEQMLLCGIDPALLQGCEVHGYFIDADTQHHTSMAGGIDYAAINARREDEDAVAADQRKRLEAERERIEQQRDKAAAEQRVRSDILESTPETRAAARASAERVARRVEQEQQTRDSQLIRFAEAQQLREMIASIGEVRVESALTMLAERVASLESEREQLRGELDKLRGQVEWLTDKVKRS